MPKPETRNSRTITTGIGVFRLPLDISHWVSYSDQHFGFCVYFAVASRLCDNPQDDISRLLQVCVVEFLDFFHPHYCGSMSNWTPHLCEGLDAPEYLLVQLSFMVRNAHYRWGKWEFLDVCRPYSTRSSGDSNALQCRLLHPDCQSDSVRSVRMAPQPVAHCTRVDAVWAAGLSLPLRLSSLHRTDRICRSDKLCWSGIGRICADSS